MTSSETAHAGQQLRPVVALSCDNGGGRDGLALCRALVQAMAEVAPTHSFRINPQSAPSDAFDVALRQTGSGATGQLSWTGGHGGQVALPQQDASDAQRRHTARELLDQSPDLIIALRRISH